jgi:sulfide:quinone oxidoreductase
MRSTTLWALSQAGLTPLPYILEAANKVGFDLKALVQRIAIGTGLAPERAAIAPGLVLKGREWPTQLK